MTRVAFVNTETGVIESIYIPSSLDTMPGNPIISSEPTAPEGCVRMEIPDSILLTDAMKVVRDEAGEITLVNDEEKLAGMRTLALPHIRKTRNELLAMTDYKMMADYVLPEEERVIWAAYRQSLREITQQDPLFVVWPIMPS